MIQKMKNIPYGTARYIVLKELDTRGLIGQLLLNYDHQLASTMMNLCDWIDRAEIALNGGNEPLSFDSVRDIPHMFIFFTEKLPYLILTASELDWTEFVSAWVTIEHHFIGVMQALSEHMQEEERHGIIELCKGIEGTFTPLYTLIDLGVSYADMIKVGNELVREMQNWRQSQPASIRLSQAYLRALGVIKDEEAGPQNCPPPPPHEVHENCSE